MLLHGYYSSSYYYYFYSITGLNNSLCCKVVTRNSLAADRKLVLTIYFFTVMHSALNLTLCLHKQSYNMATWFYAHSNDATAPA